MKLVTHHKQCKEYHKAVEDKDWFAAGIWYQPPTYASERAIEMDLTRQTGKVINNTK